MGIIEKYSRSINSSNLKNDDRHFDADNLGAVASASKQPGCELAIQLYRVKYGSDATSYNALLDGWKSKVAKKAELRQWPKHISAKKVAEMSLDYWLNSVCEVCEGRGYEVQEGSPFLSDVLCKCCQGDKKKPLVCEANWREYLLDMQEDLDEMVRYAGGQAMKQLADDMDF